MNKNGNFELKPFQFRFLMDSTEQITESGLPILSVSRMSLWEISSNILS